MSQNKQVVLISIVFYALLFIVCFLGSKSLREHNILTSTTFEEGE